MKYLCIIFNNETFYPVKEYNENSYFISRYGNLYSMYNKGLMKQQKSPKGYLQLSLRKNGKQYHPTVHRVVAKTFIPNPYNLPQVNHIDGCKENNAVENLEWCTNDYNIRHSWENNLRSPNYGETNGNSKLDKEQVIEIFTSDSTSKSLSLKFGVESATINRIRSGDSWRHVTKDIVKSEVKERLKSKYGLSIKDVEDIFCSNKTYKELSLIYNCSWSVINNIKSGNTYDYITNGLKKGGIKKKRLDKQTIIDIYTSKQTQKEISHKYGVSESTVNNIRNNHIHTHITKNL